VCEAFYHFLSSHETICSKILSAQLSDGLDVIIAESLRISYYNEVATATDVRVVVMSGS